jgi:hypothetical protein
VFYKYAVEEELLKVVTIPLAPRTARAIDLTVGERACGPLFLAADERRLDRHGTARIVRRVTGRAGISKHVSPHTLRHAFITAAQMGRIASDATFPGKRDHASAGDANRGHHGNAGAYDSEPAGQDGRVNTDCIRSIDDVPDPVALGDGMLRLLQRQTAATRADAGYGELPR